MRLPPLANSLTSSLNAPVAKLRARIPEVSQEAVTGRRVDLIGHLNGNIGDAFLSQKAAENIATEREQLQIRETRLDIVQSSLTRIQDTTAGIGTRLQAAIGLDDGPSIEFASREAASAIEQVFSALNVRLGERYLFAGDATATPPLSNADQLLTDIRAIAASAADAADFNTQINNYFDTPAGPYQQGIYAGSQNISDADAVNAIDPAITELIKGLSVLSLAQTDLNFNVINNDPNILQSAASTLLSSETAITNLRADQGIKQERVARAQTTLNLEETILARAFNDLTGRDQFEAATELRRLETNLEASFLLTSRLANLQFLNFVR
jgi:flagellar hook-associated protein 3 FlgL